MPVYGLPITKMLYPGVQVSQPNSQTTTIHITHVPNSHIQNINETKENASSQIHAPQCLIN